MRRLATPFLILLSLCGAARADEAFDDFRNFCLAGHGQSAPALAAADAAGWLAMPPQALSQFPQFQGADGRLLQTAGGAMVLITGRNQTDLGPMRICTIGVVPAGVSNLAGQLQAFTGLPKQTAPNLPEGLYAWREAGGARVSVDRNAPDFRAQFTGGGAMIATTYSTPQMSTIQLMTAAQ